MTREEAEHEATRRNREHPDRNTHGWIARPRGNDEWSLVKVPRPPGSHVGPLKAAIEAKPKPPQPDDPRPNYWRDTGGPWVG